MSTSSERSWLRCLSRWATKHEAGRLSDAGARARGGVVFRGLELPGSVSLPAYGNLADNDHSLEQFVVTELPDEDHGFVVMDKTPEEKWADRERDEWCKAYAEQVRRQQNERFTKELKKGWW